MLGTKVRNIIDVNYWNIIQKGLINNDAVAQTNEEIFKIIPKIKGGQMTIMMGNIRGMPTNNQNRSKVKKINELMKDTEIVALTETGSTKKDQTWICNDQMEIVKENKAIHNKDGVLVCGKGTLIATKKDV